MMNEQRRMEIQKQLDDEERVRRMREGGEEMRAQLDMERAQRTERGEGDRGSGLTPDEERRREMERQGAHRGLGETQQALMASWEREGASRPPIEGESHPSRWGKETTYPAGTGSMYRDPNVQPTGRASTGEPFTSGPSMAGMERGERMSSVTYYPAGTGSVYRDPNAPPTGRASTGEYFTSGPEATGQAPREVPSGYYGPEGPGMAPTVPPKAKGVEQSRRAEDIASRAGEVIGKTIRKTVAVTKEMGHGIRKGLGQERKKASPESKEMTEAEATTTDVRSVVQPEKKQ